MDSRPNTPEHARTRREHARRVARLSWGRRPSAVRGVALTLDGALHPGGEALTLDGTLLRACERTRGVARLSWGAARPSVRGEVPTLHG